MCHLYLPKCQCLYVSVCQFWCLPTWSWGNTPQKTYKAYMCTDSAPISDGWSPVCSCSHIYQLFHGDTCTLHEAGILRPFIAAIIWGPNGGSDDHKSLPYSPCWPIAPRMTAISSQCHILYFYTSFTYTITLLNFLYIVLLWQVIIWLKVWCIR